MKLWGIFLGSVFEISSYSKTLHLYKYRNFVSVVKYRIGLRGIFFGIFEIFPYSKAIYKEAGFLIFWSTVRGIFKKDKKLLLKSLCFVLLLLMKSTYINAKL